MKQKLFIILGLAVLIVILVGLNAVSYTQKEKELDSEFYPNRSTYNLGSTGTRAFFDLLTETGRKPVRWQNAPAELLTGKTKPATFVIIGQTRRQDLHRAQASDPRALVDVRLLPGLAHDFSCARAASYIAAGSSLPCSSSCGAKLGT